MTVRVVQSCARHCSKLYLLPLALCWRYTQPPPGVEVGEWIARYLESMPIEQRHLEIGNGGCAGYLAVSVGSVIISTRSL